MNMELANITAGLLLLLAGRKLFWVFVGILGFLAGIYFSRQYFSGLTSLEAVMFSFCVGVLGGLLALLFQWLAVLLAGFLGGGYLLMNIAVSVGWPQSWNQEEWVIFIAGGLLGAALAGLFFDWTLILLSTVLGSLLIIQNFAVLDPARSLLFAACLIAGIAVQAYLLKIETEAAP